MVASPALPLRNCTPETGAVFDIFPSSLLHSIRLHSFFFFLGVFLIFFNYYLFAVDAYKQGRQRKGCEDRIREWTGMEFAKWVVENRGK